MQECACKRRRTKRYEAGPKGVPKGKSFRVKLKYLGDGPLIFIRRPPSKYAMHDQEVAFDATWGFGSRAVVLTVFASWDGTGEGSWYWEYHVQVNGGMVFLGTTARHHSALHQHTAPHRMETCKRAVEVMLRQLRQHGKRLELDRQDINLCLGLVNALGGTDLSNDK